MGIFDAIGDACSAVVDVVSDVGEIAVDVATLDIGGVIDGAGDLVGHIGDTFEAVTGALGPIGSVLDEALGALTSGGGLGGLLNSALDSLGMPDWIGDIGGGVLDFCTGNFIGAAANGLDALEDVAEACGGDELAGFLQAGSQITGMFSGGLAIDAGQIDDFIGEASGTISTIEDTLGSVESLLSGDIIGAGKSLLDTFGADLGALDVLDSALAPLSDRAEGLLGAVLAPTGSIFDAIGAALDDGKLGFDDLVEMPFGEVSQNLFGIDPGIFFDQISAAVGEPLDFEQQEGFLESIGGGVVDFIAQGTEASGLLNLGQEIAELPLVSTLLGGIVESLSEQLGLAAGDLGRLGAQVRYTSELFDLAAADPDSLGIIEDLLSQAPALNGALGMILNQGGTLRA